MPRSIPAALDNRAAQREIRASGPTLGEGTSGVPDEPCLRDHPCRTCGACCATFRVSLYRAELDTAWGAVPSALTEDIGPFRVAMRGTTTTPPRCTALEGEVGVHTTCAIHAVRPDACRAFGASWEQGIAEPRCDAARARHGLTPLTPEDWRPLRPGRAA